VLPLTLCHVHNYQFDQSAQLNFDPMNARTNLQPLTRRRPMISLAEHVLLYLVRLGQQRKRREVEGYIVDSADKNHIVSGVHKVIVIVVWPVNEWRVHSIIVKTQEILIIGHGMRNFRVTRIRLQIGYTKVIVGVVITGGVRIVDGLKYGSK
jgi:hypothetical protein